MKALFELFTTWFIYIEKWGANILKKNRTKRAIRIARQKKEITGKTHYVITLNEAPLIVNRNDIQALKKLGLIKASATISDILSSAIYKTPNNHHLETNRKTR